MSKSRTLAGDLLKLLYKGTAIANVADNAASSPITNVQVALHSAWPGETDTQSTSEISYTGYGRVAVARGAGWTVTDDYVVPAATISFGACTAGSATAMFFSTGEGSSGATKIWHRGVIGSRLGPFVGATSDTITIPGLSGVSVSDRIVFLSTNGSSLPTGITEGTVYFVKTVSSNDITVSTTDGGATLDITAAGDGVAFKVTPLVITSAPSVTPQLSTSSTIYEE
jgi:hypothetical protein